MMGYCRFLHAVPLILLMPLIATPAHACTAPERCEVEGGYYLASPPPDWDGKSPLPLVVFYHGWNSSPEGTFRNRAMVNAVHRRGAMFAAPWAQRGFWRQIGPGRAEAGRDELNYTKTVLADIRTRWPIDENGILASGFSRGASMVWNLACYGADLFTAFAPIAGGFWNSNPDTCPTGPMKLRHIHGRKDRIAPLDAVGPYNSMPISEGMKILQEFNGCGSTPDPVTKSRSSVERYACRNWTACAAGGVLSLCLHPGGHSIPAEWVAEGYDWMLGLEY